MTDTDNVLVALTGAVYRAPSGTAIPTSYDDELDPAFVDLGYISEDGITESPSDDTAEIKAWQNGDTVRRLITGSSTTYGFTLIETTADGLAAYHKGSVVESDGSGGGVVEVKSPTPDRGVWVFDVLDGDKVVRWVVEDGEVTERGDITYKNDEPVGYELTVAAYPNEDRVHTVKFFSELAGVAGS